MGMHVKADVTLMFYHQLPRIDLTWTFTFDTASIGTFFDDDSKLRVHWPLSFAGNAYHDIPFGVIRTWDERPFFPASWVDISDGKKGLAYFHRGTCKHWISGQTLVNLFAWGEDTDAIGNRLVQNRWLKSFDQRLRGSHTIHCALYPHLGDWRAADVISVARSYGSPPVAYLTDAHDGELPASMEVLTLTDPGAAATAVKVEGLQIICRMYAATGETASAEVGMQSLKPVGLRSLAREQITHLNPFQIGELILEPRGKA
jgi:alpha-mannosidase